MVSESWILNKIPKQINVHTERLCECKQHTLPLSIQYNLEIDVVTYTERYSDWSTRFRINYKRADWCFYGDMRVGEVGGIGYKTIKEAVKNLIPYIREVKNNGN